MSEYKIIQDNKCIICDKDVTTNKLLCLECWKKQKNINKKNEHLSRYDVKTHYFNQKEAISRIWNLEYVINAMYILISLALELENDYDDNYLTIRIAKDIDSIRAYKFNKNKTIIDDDTLKDKESNKISFDDKDFRQINPAHIQAKDGHYVRSRGELIIDNWLFDNKYWHIYEKRVVMDTDLDAVVICDFYLVKEDIYIEFWGMKDNKEYEERKKYKIKMYDENKYIRLDLFNEDVDRPEDLLGIKIKKKIREKEEILKQQAIKNS